LLRSLQLHRPVWAASVAVRGSKAIPAPIETATTPGRRTPGRRILQLPCLPGVVPVLSLARLMVAGFRFATSCREGYRFRIPAVEYTIFPPR
jgi:hypothetical protein